MEQIGAGDKAADSVTCLHDVVCPTRRNVSSQLNHTGLNV